MHIEANFSSIWLAILAVAGGLGMLVAGGDFLISGAVKLSKRLGMSPLLVGLTVVAFGTSMPELFVSLSAMLNNHPNIMLGNVVGSNIANIGLVLAIAAVLCPININIRKMSLEFYLVTGAGCILLGAGFFQAFPRILGITFVGGIIAYTIFSCKRKIHADHSPDNQTTKPAPTFSYFSIFMPCIAGLVFMWFGSDYFIDGAVDLARFFGMSELVIGLTLAAIGTSLPELASSISAIRKKQGDMLVGNILGSNLFNLLLVLGLTGTIKPFLIPAQAVARDLPIMLAFTVALIPMAFFSHRISRLNGLGLLSAYLFYIYLLA